jgi:hypothetical protein
VNGEAGVGEQEADILRPILFGRIDPEGFFPKYIDMVRMLQM